MPPRARRHSTRRHHHAGAPQPRHPFPASSINHCVMPVSRRRIAVPRRRASRHRCLPPRAAANAVSTRASSSVPTTSAPITAGPVAVTSAPMVIRAAPPGGSCSVCRVTAISNKHMARRFMANTSHPICWCGPWARWPKGWASALWPGCSRSIPTPCWHGWSRWRTISRPFHSISSMTCGSPRCNWTNSMPCSVP